MSPQLMSIISTGGRTYGFDLDIIKSPSPPSAIRSSSSSPSSTISDSSNSPLAISTKRARAPRKRPNQTYTEAAALLSTIDPNLFSEKNLLHTLSKNAKVCSSFQYSLSSFPLVCNNPSEDIFLIEDTSSCFNYQQLSPRSELKPCSPNENSCIEYQEPNSPDYDVESILREEVGEGIDSIMGNSTVENSERSLNMSSYIKSFKGFGYGPWRSNGNNLHQAIRKGNDGEWWRKTTLVPMKDIVQNFNAKPASLEKKKKNKKKKKKKVEEEVTGESNVVANKSTTKTIEAKEATTSPIETASTKTVSSLGVQMKSTGLGLKLNHQAVISAWSEHGFPFGSESGIQESSSDILARLSGIELFPEIEGGGIREASVQRYKEKRRNRLFSKKIRYQVRKVNADQRPRMKASGRFVKRPDLIQEEIEADTCKR